jgi:hypothetical protein
MDKTKLVIKEDITDWMDEALRDENIIASEEDVYQALVSGLSTAKLARATIVSRELKKAPEEIIRPNKILLMAGAIADVISLAHKKKVEVTTESGRTYEINAFVGKGHTNENGNGEVENETDSGPSFVALGDKLALDRSLLYLASVVPGHIWHRLLTIYQCGGDVRQAAIVLQATIDQMVEKILEPGTK